MNERQIFNNALGIENTAERSAYLNQACAGDAALRENVQGLLEAHEQLGSFLVSTPVAAAGTTDGPRFEQPGSMIGPYKLLQQIGEGGFGVVYMAEQTEPLKRRVALKIIKPGMDTRQVIARFEAERQALALMDHPNIAKVFDAGMVGPVCRTGPEALEDDTQSPARQAGPTGRPYFVMELVKGVPITAYCDEKQKTLKERLELFIPVCQAVQHAHQKGVIHRDLKPSNVLIAPYDSKPVVKVIDFGVAKATGQRLTERTLFTEFGAVVGTLEYMSPEQAELNNQDIDTRSDIYSLGVLLYELLTGTTPLDRARLKQTAFMELLRIIREEEPPRPSTRLSGSKHTLSAIAAQRQTEPAKLAKLVRGELDWVVMKCLDKDRNRRYETAAGLARDLQRFLEDEAVSACPPSAGYRLRKFARRNKRLLATVSLAVVALLATLALVIGSAFTLRLQVALDDAEVQRQKAEVFQYFHHIAVAHAEWRDGNVGRMEPLLDDCPPKHRNWEWHYLKRLCHPEILTLHGQVGDIWDVTFSPDGKYVAAGGNTSTPEIKIWNATTGELVHTLSGHRDYSSVMFSPDGKLLASVSGKTVKVWDLTTGRGGREIQTMEVESARSGPAVFGSDGARLLTPGIDGTLTFWDVATGALVGKQKGPTNAVTGTSVAFSPDRTRIATGSGKTIWVWDAATGQVVHKLDNGHKGTVWRMAFSPDGNLLASPSHDQTIKIWDMVTGEALASLTGHSGGVWSVTFSPDGNRLASASVDQTVRVWDTKTGQELFALRGHTSGVTHVAFSRTERALLRSVTMAP